MSRHDEESPVNPFAVLEEIEEAALALPDTLATFFYADDPVVPLIHRLWRALGRELPPTCLCSFCDPIHDALVGVQP